MKQTRFLYRHTAGPQKCSMSDSGFEERSANEITLRLDGEAKDDNVFLGCCYRSRG